ncbi:MAG: uracil-DNA glycosylase family protein [Prevotella sp.]|nr:uracil-DNA glycosylase family protein [Prevotella sp.]MCM1075381.1 DNA glycosylase [Ruminococcus sp.]
MNTENLETETHPWPPFIPNEAKVLIMGTFPPQPHRWSMNFYYPNRTNDFWYMMGLIFFHDKYALYNIESKSFYLDKIKDLLNEKGIALNDTGRKVRRLKGNASDKYLEILEPIPLHELLHQMPDCRHIATTGEKAAGIIASLTDTRIPQMGEYEISDTGLYIWRMPSTSRAYPLALEKKADFYKKLFTHAGILIE